MSNWVTIGPNDFVSGPYVPCQLCREPRLGIVSIGPDVVVRRCTNCQAKTRQDLPRLNKRIVFVDQSAISNMMLALHPTAGRTGHHSGFWRKLFSQLDRLVRMQLIACPSTSIHVNESMVAPQIEADLLRVAVHLSAGVRFLDRHDIEMHQILLAARAWHRGQPIALQVSDWRFALEGDPTGWTDRLTFAINIRWTQDYIDTVRLVRDGTEEDLIPVFERWRSERMDFGERFRQEAMGVGRAKLDAERRRLQMLADIQSGRAQPTPGTFMPGFVSPVLQVFHALLDEGLDAEAATRRSIEFFQSEAMLAVPFIRLSAMLWAALAREAQNGRRRPPDRGTSGDFAAISTSLPYCHVMVVDKKCAEYLAQEPLAAEVARYGCRVFSLSSQGDLLAHLADIEASATEQHKSLIAEMYGPMPSEAPLIFDKEHGPRS